ncbi:molecular chaperone DnaK [Porphyromonas sp. HMSC077F02]|uniref:TraR/DksA family transcriptional regulator n=1 Tax=Porphyromonas TaxID=836 RepID=UPI0003381825|nr:MULTISPECIES: TraR/DksA C4-type zinc finger protein [Porphyromonas]MDD7557631.1 TraR/DksA C4-type zinc finger protein [Porphyromonas somerae]MDY3120414.1 TraR/DksA C4-type zinc finger protein [Porphyromonas somerae]MDY3884229.1 TraR/DksA C4-type zinc finger protein [Porphyromonas somerae]MDY5816176.1 TraR/DksA C4-type zinc finger protein [Porphyromonas somerae]OFO54198.1 molecular chaperone DnaK [Porphyromonas sp. HMSC077F02]
MEKNSYSPEELQEFREIIEKKLAKARRNYDLLVSTLDTNDGNDITDTTPTYKNLTESAMLLSKQETASQAARQQKFIKNLEAALVRIENGTYGICRATGKLIPKERLRAVPHATLSIEAKESGHK